MRALALLSSVSLHLSTLLILLPSSTISFPDDQSPRQFLNPLPQGNRQSSPVFLFKRQNCPSDHTSCSTLGASNACCPTGTNCARDNAGNVACCPINAYCTGVISGTASASTISTGTGTTSGFVLGGTTTTTSMSLSTITSAPTSLPTGYSTVPNAYYPFIYIPTTYSNAQACSSAYSNCQSASTACFASLAGVQGVTVAGIGGGTTVQGSTGTILSSASLICSSLSQQGCWGLQSTQCSLFGSGGASSTASFVQGANAAEPRRTGCPAALYAAAAGVGVVGAMEAFVY